MSNSSQSLRRKKERKKINDKIRKDSKWASACRMYEIRYELALRAEDAIAVNYIYMVREQFMRLARSEFLSRPENQHLP